MNVKLTFEGEIISDMYPSDTPQESADQLRDDLHDLLNNYWTDLVRSLDTSPVRVREFMLQHYKEKIRVWKHLADNLQVEIVD